MSNFSENLKNLRRSKKLTQKELSDITGIPISTIAHYEAGSRIPSVEQLKTLSNFFKVSTDYLLGEADEYVNFWDNLDKEIGEAKLRALAKEVRDYESGVTSINVYGSIPAGVPIEAVQDIEDTVTIPTSWVKGGNEYIALRVKGDSMFPRYEDGDIVIIHIQPDCENGDDCACYVNGYDVTLKRVYKGEHSITLQPLNSSYQPMTYKHPGEVRILGKVVELRRIMK